MITKHMRFPTKLFTLCLDPAPIDDLTESCESSRDEYTAGFLSRFAGPLDAPAAVGELAMIVMAGRSSIARIESLNATIRRSLVAASVQTRRPDVPSLSADFVLGKVRRRERDLRLPPGSLQSLRKVKPKVKRSGHRMPQSVKRRGGGGRWRLFISLQCRGGGVRADFAELGRRYRSLSDAQKEALDTRAAEATAAHRAGGSAFGLHSRQRERLGLRLSLRNRASALARQLSSKMCSSRALAIPTTDIEGILQRTRQDGLEHRRLQREIAHNAADHLSAHRSKEGVHERDRFLLIVPALASDAPAFTGDPGGANMSLLSWCAPLGKMVPRIMGMCGGSRDDKIINDLIGEWEMKHRTCLNHVVPQIPDDRVGRRKTPTCLGAGVCICGAGGDVVVRMKTWLITALKKCLEPVGRKKSLADGLIIIQLTGESESIGIAPSSARVAHED